MLLINTTPVPDRFIRAVVRWVRPPTVTKLRQVKFRTASHGTIHGHGGSGVIYGALADPKKIRFPNTGVSHGAYLGVVTYTIEEMIVAFIAHEMRHCWQTVHPSGRRVWGAKGQYSERDADAYAIKMLRKYRRGQLFGGDDKHWNSQRIVLRRPTNG